MRLVLSLAFCMVAIMAPISAAAQDAPQRVKLTVAVMQEVPFDGANSVILRRTDEDVGDGSAHDVLVIRASTLDRFTLSAAIKEVLMIRRTQGDFSLGTRVLRVRPHDGPPGQALRALPWAERIVRDLETAEIRAITTLGPVRAVDIWLPRQIAAGPQDV